MTSTSGVIQDSALFSSKELGTQVDSYRQLLINVQANKGLHKLISDDFVELADFFIETANQHYSRIDSDEVEVEEVYLFHYKLSEPFKDLLFIHRDVLLQLQIAKHKHYEFIVSDSALQTHFNKSRKVLLEALDAFVNKLVFERNEVYKDVKKRKKTLKKYKHLQNPWSIYDSQFKELLQQINEIKIANKSFSIIVNQFIEIKNYSIANCGSIIQNARYLLESSSKTIDELKTTVDVNQINDKLSFVEDLLKKIRENNNEQDDYTEGINLKIQPLDEVTVPITTNEGLLLTRKIDFKKAVQRWLDYELLQILIDLWENDSRMVSYLKHNLLNLNSSLTLAKKNNSLNAISFQTNTFKNVHEDLVQNVEKQENLAKEFSQRLETDFFATKVYSDKNFLDVSLQSSLSQITTNNTNLYTQLKSRLEKLYNDFSSKYEEKLSSSPDKRLENSAKCIKYRMYKEENEHYDTLFLNKTLIGDLFIVPRTDEEKRVETTITQWQDGFNKSILVTGDALSGKSTFIEYISKKYFKKEVLFLQPNSEVILGGRKLKTTKTLKTTLEALKKDIYSTDPVIVIDDLELWRDNDVKLLENVRALIKFIENDSDEALIIATISKEMYRHLENRLSFSNGFSTIIDVTKAKTEEVYKALMLRHGASHKKLVNQDDELLTQKSIEQYVIGLCKEFDNNIGEVLQSWTYSTTVINNNNVIYNEKSLPFEDFFTDEEAIILKHILFYQKINELELKQFLGRSFEISYKSGLKRLNNAKVLLRDEQGFLRINPVLNHDIHRILKYRGLLK